MKKIFFLFLLALAACNNLPKDNSGKIQVSNEKDELPYGQMVFEKYCVSCHGTGGDGNSNDKANLTKTTLDQDAIGDVVYHGRALMPMFNDKLGEPEIRAVSAYVLSLHK